MEKIQELIKEIDQQIKWHLNSAPEARYTGLIGKAEAHEKSAKLLTSFKRVLEEFPSQMEDEAEAYRRRANKHKSCEEGYANFSGISNGLKQASSTFTDIITETI